MDLGSYLRENNITMSDFGKRIGRAQSIVSRLVNKRHRADPSTALRIVRVTGGKISLDDLYGTPAKLRADYLARGGHH